MKRISQESNDHIDCPFGLHPAGFVSGRNGGETFLSTTETQPQSTVNKSQTSKSMKKYISLIAVGLMLAAVTPLQTRAASNTWTGAGGTAWNTSTVNWASPTTWVQGSDAVFGPAGAPTVDLGANIFCRNMTFNTNYTVSANSYFFTNTSASGQSFITAAAGTSNNLALAIYGTNSMTFQGAGTTVLLGDSTINDANHYTGGTYVRAGTLILRAAGVGTSTAVGSSHAVGNIEAIDAGATVQIGTTNDGVANFRPPGPDGQILRGNNLGRLNLTGGTFDNNGDNNGIQYPCPEGTGTILNSSPYIRGAIKIAGPNTGQTFVFNGQIKDGGPNVTTSQGIAYQENLDMNGNTYTLVLGGVNTFTGFLRLSGSGNKIILQGAGTLGFPPPSNFPARQILMNSGSIDLNGTSQKCGYVFTGNNTDSIITNGAFGTVSTLTVCYNNTNLTAFNGAATPRGIRCGLLDDPATGGTLALTKEGSGIQPIGVYAADVGTALANNYHGDTTVNNGILEIVSVSGISPNSAYRLNSPGVLQLDYAGTSNVKQLYVNGAQKANGIYGAADFPGIITGTGTITVTGSTGSSVAKTWSNGSADSNWNTTSVNWTGLTWSQGESAVFGPTGAPTVNLTEDVTCPNLTFYGTNYTINANTKFFTNESASGQSFITSASGTTNSLNLAIYGTNSMTFQGGGTTVLAGDATINDANHYTGDSYFRSGTVILRADGAGTSSAAGSSHAVESIAALDAGATLQFGTTFNGVSWVSAPGEQIAARVPGAKMIMTGGTLDLNNDPKNEVVRVPDGFGLIINNGSSVQAGLNVIMDGANHTFSGVIADGNNGVLIGDNFGSGATPQGPGYQIGIVSISGTAGSTWTLAGDNTYSGSTRIDGNTIVKLAGNHSLGIPTLTNGLTGPMRIINGSALDMNGRNQTMSLMQNGDPGAKIYNSAVGTVSTLTVGYGMEPVVRNCPYQLMDNTGVGGKFALRKINTQPYSLIQSNITTMVVTTNVVTTCTQNLRNDCVATYSGDTSIEGGTLQVSGTTGISPNSVYRITTTNAYGPGVLKLSYAGNANCRQLWINGVQQTNGIYNSTTTGIDPASTGTITVTGFAPVTLNAVLSGSNLNLSWTGCYKLQSCLNDVTGIYTDYVGGSLNAATVPINPAAGAVFFRLVTF